MAANMRMIWTEFYLIWKNLSTLRMNIAIKIGNRQYPRIATDWKNEISPPRTLILKVTIVAPTKTEKKMNKNYSESTLPTYYCWWKCRRSGTWRKDPTNPSFWACTNSSQIEARAHRRISYTYFQTHRRGNHRDPRRVDWEGLIIAFRWGSWCDEYFIFLLALTFIFSGNTQNSRRNWTLQARSYWEFSY